MRMKMDNSRFLFALAVASLVVLGLASSVSKLIAPCDCLPPLAGTFRVYVYNKMSVPIQVVFTKKEETETINLDPGDREPLDVPGGTWTWVAMIEIGTSTPGGGQWRTVRSGSVSDATTIMIAPDD